MAVPVALKAFLRIVLSLQAQELRKLRIAGLDVLQPVLEGRLTIAQDMLSWESGEA